MFVIGVRLKKLLILFLAMSVADEDVGCRSKGEAPGGRGYKCSMEHRSFQLNSVQPVVASSGKRSQIQWKATTFKTLDRETQ